MKRISGNYPFKTAPAPEFDLRVLSLGAGVQSTRLLLGILEGEYNPCPTVAIFADTGWEPRPVYEQLERLIDLAEDGGITVHIVSAGNIRNDAARTTRGGKREGRFASIPLHTLNEAGEPMMMRRQCTREYKIEPIERKVREIVGLEPRQRAHTKRRRINVESWQGISWDEIQRMRVNPNEWIWNRYPLIERRETRADCLKWIAEHGYPEPPKSACIGCPYHDNAYWLWLRENAPEDLEDAIEFDDQLEDGAMGWDRPAYLHRSRRRLRDVIPDLEILAEQEAAQGQLFGMLDECEGICGV